MESLLDKLKIGSILAVALFGCDVNTNFNYQREIKGYEIQIKNGYQFAFNDPASYKDSKKDNKKPDKKESDKDLEEKVDYLDILVYVYDEKSKSGELRMKVDRLSEEEKKEYISMKGTSYNKEKGYISFSEKFEDKKFYKSMKDVAILFQFYKRENISDKEKEFIRNHAPDVYGTLFPFDTKYDEKKTTKSDKKLEKKFKESPFLKSIIESWLKTKAENEMKDIGKSFRNSNISEKLIKGKLPSEPEKENKKNKNSEEAPVPPM